MKEQPNKVELEIARWSKWEKRHSELFSFDMSNNRALMKEKLRHYEAVAQKFASTRNRDERLTLRLLKQERRSIERRLYPNLAARLLRRLVLRPLRRLIVKEIENRRLQRRSDALQQDLQRAGLSNFGSQAAEKIKKGEARFTIPTSRYVNEEERLDQQLTFGQDKNGRYRLQELNLSIHNELKPELSRQHRFDLENGPFISLQKAENLLYGRAVEHDGKWMKLDFNDRSADGQYRMKEFHSDFGFNLEKVIRDLPIKGLTDNTRQELLESLKQGNRGEVTFDIQGQERKFSIDANPQFKSVNIFDGNAKKISLSEAMGEQTMSSLKVAYKAGQQKKKVNRKTGTHL